MWHNDVSGLGHVARVESDTWKWVFELSVWNGIHARHFCELVNQQLEVSTRSNGCHFDVEIKVPNVWPWFHLQVIGDPINNSKKLMDQRCGGPEGPMV